MSNPIAMLACFALGLAANTRQGKVLLNKAVQSAFPGLAAVKTCLSENTPHARTEPPKSVENTLNQAGTL